MDLGKKHYQIIEKIRQAFHEKMKTGYTDPEEVKLINDLISGNVLNKESFFFNREGNWIYQNGFNMPFTSEGIKKLKKDTYS